MNQNRKKVFISIVLFFSSTPSSSSTTSEITITRRPTESSSISPPPTTTTAATITTIDTSPPSSSLMVPIEIDCSLTTVRNTTDETNDFVLESHATSTSPETNEVTSATTDNLTLTQTEKRRLKKIDKLERRLDRLSRVIKELEEKDMSLEEMEHCDLYVVESNLKRQAFEVRLKPSSFFNFEFVFCDQVHEKLLQARNESNSIDRILYRSLTFPRKFEQILTKDQSEVFSSLIANETGHPLISRALEEMVNQTQFFPSFTDVLEVVEKVNKENNLRLR